MELETLSDTYTVRALTDADIPDVLELYKGNPFYFQHCPPAPSAESVQADLRALPPGKQRNDKFFLGFFEGKTLVAVMDLIAQYPDAETAFIGLFMVAKAFQDAGIGTKIVFGCLQSLRRSGYSRVQLGYVKTNYQVRSF